jgi:hypothetical protein
MAKGFILPPGARPLAGDAPLRNREGAAGTLASMLDESLFVQDGCPLDVENLRGTAMPAGSNGRVIVHSSDTSQLAEANAPTTPIKLRIATWSPSMSFAPLTDKDHITRAVENIARRGYNAMRVHGVELWLMDKTTGDFASPADRLDLFDWLLAELKRCGIYWILEVRQDELYFDGRGGGRFSMSSFAPYCRTRIFVEQAIRDHWREGVSRLYGRVNPYTGTVILQDPALFLFECYNENAADFHNGEGKDFPADWLTRKSAQGSAAMTWPEWIVSKWGTIAALNAAWGTAYASFANVPTPPRTAASGADVIQQTQQAIDTVLYYSYLDAHIMAWFKSTLRAIGYPGLVSGLISFVMMIHLRNGSRSADNDLLNLHNYPFLTDEGADELNRDMNVPIWGSDTRIGFPRWAATASAYSSGKPAYFGEFGWPYWGAYRNQYPFLAAYGAIGAAPAISHYAQGNWLLEKYDATGDERERILYPYYTQSDPVVAFSEAASLFAHRHVTPTPYTQEVIVSDRYCGINETGTSPRTASRVTRTMSDLFLPMQSLPAIVRTKLTYSDDNTNDELAATWNAKSWFTLLDDLKTAGGITTANKSWISANANRGTITAVTTSGTVGSVTASPTQPVLTIGSNTLVDYDHIAIRSLTGSTGTWPGTSLRALRAIVIQTGAANQVQVVSGLNLTGLSGFTAGDWCEWDNVLESANGQVLMSRREKRGYINTARFVMFAHNGAALPVTIGDVTITSLTTGGAIFVAALDDQPISSSARLLVGLVGNSTNTGETYDSTGRYRTAHGVYPIQITDCTAQISVAVSKPWAWSMYRLDRTGARNSGETIAGNVSAGTISATLRTGTVQPTTFFELVR